MSTLGPPFNEQEERHVLAEVLKWSALPPSTLLNFIRDAGVEPAWSDMTLPFGRSVSASQQAYQALFARTSAEPRERKNKRPHSIGDPTSSSSAVRELQPRPPSFATVNDPILSSPAGGDERPKKKRGRPSKEEHERRVAEAAARGEVYPKPRKPKTPRPSMEGAEFAGTPQATPGTSGQAWVAEGTASHAHAGPEATGGVASGPSTSGGAGQGGDAPSRAGQGDNGRGTAPMAVMFTPNRTGPPNEPTIPASSKKKKRPAGKAAEGAYAPTGLAQHEEQRAAEAGASSEAQMSGYQSNDDLLIAELREHASMPDNQPAPMRAPDNPPSSGSTGYGGPDHGHMFQSFHADPRRHQQ